MRRITAAILVLGGLAGCETTSGGGATANPPRVSPGRDDGAAPIDRSYQPAGFSWRRGGEVILLSKVMESQGLTRICGAYDDSKLGPGLRDKTQEVLGSTSLRMGPIHLSTGVSFYAGLDARRPLGGQSAKCVLTDLPWSPEFEKAPLELRGGRRAF